MATKNPFGNLTINRDDEDDDGMIRVTPKNTTSASMFTNVTEMKKKKKVRPEENRQKETVQEVTEGFEVVGKTNKRPYTAKNNSEEGEEQKKEDKPKHKGTGNKDRVYNKTRPQKRQYEKHSGTGRGKETAKGGAGGKTVWGDNPDQIARQAKSGTRDDYLFESVLNPKKEETKVEAQVEEEVKETVEETPVEEVQEKAEHVERKEKVVAEEEIPPEERLDRPEGALSLAEYREQMKEKNKKILGGNKAQTLKVDLPSDLKVIEKEKVEIKQKKVTKAKKADHSVQQVNVEFKTEDLSNPRYQKPQYQNNQNKKPQKAKIDVDSLPSL